LIVKPLFANIDKPRTGWCCKFVQNIAYFIRPSPWGYCQMQQPRAAVLLFIILLPDKKFLIAAGRKSTDDITDSFAAGAA